MRGIRFHKPQDSHSQSSFPAPANSNVASHSANFHSASITSKPAVKTLRLEGSSSRGSASAAHSHKRGGRSEDQTVEERSVLSTSAPVEPIQLNQFHGAALQTSSIYFSTTRVNMSDSPSSVSPSAADDLNLASSSTSSSNRSNRAGRK